MRTILGKHRQHWIQKQFSLSVAFGLTLLILSLIVNHAAGIYATAHASNAVSDILLDYLPVFDTSFVYIKGPLIFVGLITILLLLEPKRIPFVVKSIALFIIIRACFITLTHLGTIPEISSVPVSNFGSSFFFTGDLFFSGHTGMPFLMSLIFWKNTPLRWIFLSLSVITGICMLLGHYHYSIDVLSAFFITYTIFHISKTFFKKDYQLFQNGLA